MRLLQSAMPRFLTVTVIATMALLPPHVRAEPAPSEPDALSSLREAWMEAKEQDLRPIKDKYLDALIKLREQFTKQRRLGDAVLVREEIEILTQGAERKEHAEEDIPTDLDRLRTIYARETERVLEANDEKYIVALKALEQRFSASGKLEAALSVLAELEKIDNKGWLVLFRSSDPRLWNTETDDDRGFARKLSSAPKETKWLKLSNLDSAVIVPIVYEQLSKHVDLGGGFKWNGTAYFDSRTYQGKAYESTVLGIGSSKWSRRYGMKGGIVTVERRDANGRPEGLGGWGFGRAPVAIAGQEHYWDGKETKGKVFEISVSAESLTIADARLKLVD